MKKILLTALAVAFLLTAKAQSVDTTKKDTDKVFLSPEKAPQFPDGIEQFYDYLERNIHYPSEARAKQEQGSVVVIMIVEKDGSLSNVKVARHVSPSLDQEAVRVISASPKWIPGTQNGRPVRSMRTIPIAFSLGK